MIQTGFGNVGLRSSSSPSIKDPTEVKLSDEVAAEGSEELLKVHINHGWIQTLQAAIAKRDGLTPDQAQEYVRDNYRKYVMQVMLIAASETGEMDISTKAALTDPATGQMRSQERITQLRNEARQKKEGFTDGSLPVPCQHLGRMTKVTKMDPTKVLTKHMLMKRSNKCGARRVWRYFDIENGRLNVYKYNRVYERARHVYDLAAALECRFEDKNITKDCAEDWKEAPSNFRVMLKTKERIGPMYLYGPTIIDDKTGKDTKKAAPDADKTARSWVDAIRMSKYIQSPSDREALTFVVGRVTASQVTKGWAALFHYANEMMTLQKSLKQFSFRFSKADLSRGWHKASLVYNARKQKLILREEQRAYATKFLTEKMSRLNSQGARELPLVRQSMISQIQAKFRHYRKEKIFDRAYALGSSATSRVQQAQKGNPMDASFGSVTFDEAMQLVLARSQAALKIYQDAPDLLHSRKSTYSEVNAPVKLCNIAVADSLNMLCFSPMAVGFEHSSLATAKWAQYVNLDQISSVVLHSERVLDVNSDNGQELNISQAGGVWATINGPRVCWSRRIHKTIDPHTEVVKTSSVGAEDGFAVARELLTGGRIKWFRMTASPKSASIPKVPDPMSKKEIKGADLPQDGSVGQTYMVLNMLGRCFRSEIAVGENPRYSGQFTADVPITTDPESLKGLDTSIVSIEIMQVGSPPTTLWAGSLPLWKVFASDRGRPNADAGAPHDGLVSLTEQLGRGGQVQQFKEFYLVHPTVQQKTQMAFGTVELEVQASISEMPSNKCISPELQGCGLLTTLYSTHRGAWYNPSLGSTVFNANNVGNFLELKLESLTFPQTDQVDPNNLSKYHIELVCNGVSVCTAPLVRARPLWNKVLNMEPGRIMFNGTQVFVPLPPGTWLAESVRVELNVVRQPVVEMPAMNWRDMLGANRQTRQSSVFSEKPYCANLILDNMTVDHPKHLSIGCGKSQVDVPIMSKDLTAPQDACKILCDVCIRDRDYVRMTSTDSYTTQRAVFVGDAAMILAEEPLIYPQTEPDFRKRMVPGNFDKNAAQRGGRWNCELRDPCLSHEFSDSGLGKLKIAFKQRNIPGHFQDLIPYKYLLPNSEKEFVEEGRTGVFWRIMDTLSVQKSKPDQSQEDPKVANANIVKSLTHLLKKLPVTVIAVYANKTCDVELNAAFVHEWEQHPFRQYTIPGTVFMAEFKSIPEAVKGTPDAGKRQEPQITRRVLLKGVPISSVFPVHAASFNVYDATLGSVDDTIRVDTTRNTHNPRESNSSNTMGYVDTTAPMDRRGGYSIKAGPVPSDAGPGCQYEWSLHVRAPSDEDMCHFITMLKQCVRMDHFQQVLKACEAHARPAINSSIEYDMGPRRTSAGGYLEVVLVEARRLQTKRVQKHKDTTDYLKKTMLGDYNTFMLFQVANEPQPHPFPEDHEVIEGESIHVTGTISHDVLLRGDAFGVELHAGSGSQLLRFAATVQGREISWASYDADRQGIIGKTVTHGQGQKIDDTGIVNAGFQWPFNNSRYSQNANAVTMEFKCITTGATKWEVTINGRRQPELDFDHNWKTDTEKAAVIRPFGLDHPHVRLKQEEELLVHRGTKQQKSPLVSHSVSPSWAAQEGLKGTGGWVFRSPDIDPKLQPKLTIEMKLMYQGLETMNAIKELGQIRLPLHGGSPEEGGGPYPSLCEYRRPFNNLWLPLMNFDGDKMKWISRDAGEVHIMTRWVPNVQDARRVMPKTSRAFMMQELRPKLASAQLREPVYDTLETLRGYNPNMWKGDFPQSRSEVLAIHAEQLYNSVPYMDCCGMRQEQLWSQKLWADLELDQATQKKDIVEMGPGWARTFGDTRRQWLQQASNTTDQKIIDKIYTMDEYIRRGIPPRWRLSATAAAELGRGLAYHPNLWNEITNATDYQEKFRKHDKVDKVFKDPNVPEYAYMALLAWGRPKKSDAMLQLQEDMVTAASWETSMYPDVMDRHLHRLKRAQNICIALIAMSYKKVTDAEIDADINLSPEEKRIQKDAKKVLVGQRQDRDRNTTWYEFMPSTDSYATYIQQTRAYNERRTLEKFLKAIDLPDSDKIVVPTLVEVYGEDSRGVAYCESLLVIAFNLLLPQVDVEAERQKALEQRQKNPTRRPSTESLNSNQEKNGPTVEEQEESRVFWLLLTLICSPDHKDFADYYGTTNKTTRRAHPFRQMGSDEVKGDPRDGKESGGASAPLEAPLAAHTGAMRDIHLLNHILMLNYPDLSSHLNSLGFHLSSVFYGAFMRWFAFYMPTASLFRFWDLLFSESTRQSFKDQFEGNAVAQAMWDSDPDKIELSTDRKPRRHVLLDLAYSVIKACVEKLMLAESALEARDSLLSHMTGLYDPSAVIESIAEAEKELWETMMHEYLKDAGKPKFLNEFERSEKWYQHFYVVTWVQNRILKGILECPLNLEMRSKQLADNLTGAGARTSQTNQAATRKNSSVDERLTTKNVVHFIMSPLLNLFISRAGGERKYGGMWRRTEKHIAEIGPALNEPPMHKIKHFFERGLEAMNLKVIPGLRLEDWTKIFPESLPVLPGTAGEPTHMTKMEWEQQVNSIPGMNTDWGPLKINLLWESFATPEPQVLMAATNTMPQGGNAAGNGLHDLSTTNTTSAMDARMSLNELFIALVCVSKGTVGERALALFQIYAHHDKSWKLNHITPVLHHSKAVVDKVEGTAERAKNQVFAPPEEAEIPKTVALHFKVMREDHHQHVLLGEVYVTNLHPFTLAGMAKAESENYTIWAPKRKGPAMGAPGGPGMMGNAPSMGAMTDPNMRRGIGEMKLGITWVPGDAPEVGQIGITVAEIAFNQLFQQQYGPGDQKLVNPYVTVHTYDDKHQPRQIQRWDPRTGLRKGANAMTLGLAFGGAYKGHMEWEAVLRMGPTGTPVNMNKHNDDNHGFKNDNPPMGRWLWNPKWGQQFSVEEFNFRKDFVVNQAAARSNSISLKACRILTLGILRRSLVYISNRQAILLSDAAFNRAGAVPGILSAIIVAEERIPAIDGRLPTFKEFTDDYAQRGKPFFDVKPQLVVEHERQVNNNLGELDMWIRDDAIVTLDELDIKDPFLNQQKVLWIRYVRAGDGERGQEQIPVDADGKFRPRRIKMDMEGLPNRVSKAQAQMNISKEEFVSCIQDHPLLSECLRQLCTRERSMKGLPTPQAIRLDVIITDPNRRQEDDQYMDISNVRQSILLEIWDKDSGVGTDDFLGEAWLPPLGTMHAAPRRYVLPIQNMHTGAKGTATREDSRKSKVTNCQGDLHIEASWVIPNEKVPEVRPDSHPDERIKAEEIKHTGKLVLKILKAENLRSGETQGHGIFRSQTKAADPYVVGYQLNEHSGEWKPKSRSIAAQAMGAVVTSANLEEVVRTKPIKGSLNPEWNEEKTIMVQTGQYADRTKKKTMNIALTNEQKLEKEAQELEQVIGQDDIRIFFGKENWRDEKKKKIEAKTLHMRGDKYEEPYQTGRGTRHGVSIYLGDTLHQFKSKLERACKREANFERKDARYCAAMKEGKSGSTREKWEQEEKEHTAAAAQFESVRMQINHVVTVFVPSDRLRSLFNQSRTSATEYKRLFRLEESDPAFWQPLDPIRSFSNYASTYGFGLNPTAGADGKTDETPAQRLRISEATVDYKQKNQRYKRFEEEMIACTQRIDDTDTEKSCYGHGLYIHKNDSNSREWRPVLVERPVSGSDTAKRKFGIQWLYALGGADALDIDGHAELDEESVLLAPRVPHLLGSGTLEHQQFLQQAQELRNQGLPDHEIVAKLNEQLKTKFELAKQADEAGGKKSEMMMPPLISLSEVQHYFKKMEQELGAPTHESPKNSPVAGSRAPGAPVSQSPLNSDRSLSGGQMYGAGPSSGTPLRSGAGVGLNDRPPMGSMRG